MPVPQVKELSADKALTSKIDEARKLIENHAPRDSTFRYDLGAIARDIKSDPRKYGKQAVEHLAHELGYDASTLYEYAMVANAWNKPEFAKLSKKKTGKGTPLTFSHFMELARVPARKAREQLTEKVIKERLSVRDLKSAISDATDTVEGNATKVASTSTTTPPSPSPATDLSELITTTDDLIAKQTTWKTTLAGLHTLKANQTLADQIVKAIDRNRELSNACEAIAELLEIERDRIESGLA